MINSAKKIKGSAYTAPDGSFVFTPYASLPAGEKNQTLLASTRYSSMWLSKRKLSVRISFDRNFVPPFNVWLEEIQQLYSSLQHNNKPRNYDF